MPQILASSKTGSNKYDLKSNDPNKVLPRLDMRQIAQSLQTLYEVSQGYSLSGDEGSSSALATSLSIIDASNIATYTNDITQAIQTLVANACKLEVDGGSTANAIILNAPTIASGLAPDGNNYKKTTPLPFKFEEDLRFTFRATLPNTGAVTINIPGLSGLGGAAPVVTENEAALVGGEFEVGKYYTVACKTISAVKSLILLQPAAFAALQNTPYSVNKAFTVSGQADYINKVSDSEISFDVDDGTSFSPLSLTYPDGSTETITSLVNVTGISTDGLYYILKEKGTTPAVLTLSTSLVTESVVAPSTPTNGDYWLDISQSPYVPYKRIAAAWVSTQFVKLGQVTRTAGTLGTPISYALNGRYEGEQLTLANGTKYTFNHNIGTNVLNSIKYIECKTAELGYTVGDRVYNTDDGNSGTATSFYGTLETTNVDKITSNITTGASGVGGINKTTGSAASPFNTSYWKAGIIINRGF